MTEIEPPAYDHLPPAGSLAEFISDTPVQRWRRFMRLARYFDALAERERPDIAEPAAESCRAIARAALAEAGMAEDLVHLDEHLDHEVSADRLWRAQRRRIRIRNRNH